MIEDIFDGSTSGTSIWLGESGLLVVVTSVLLIISIAPQFRRPVSEAIERIAPHRQA